VIERTTFVEPVGRLLFDCDSGSIYAYLASNGVVPPRASHTIDAVAADSTDESLLDVPFGSPLLRDQRYVSRSLRSPSKWA
jgi:GntR family transcriptional regulator